MVVTRERNQLPHWVSLSVLIGVGGLGILAVWFETARPFTASREIESPITTAAPPAELVIVEASWVPTEWDSHGVRWTVWTVSLKNRSSQIAFGNIAYAIERRTKIPGDRWIECDRKTLPLLVPPQTTAGIQHVLGCREPAGERSSLRGPFEYRLLLVGADGFMPEERDKSTVR